MNVQASGIPVHCAFTRIARCADLVLRPDNPKLHPPEQLDRYEQVIVANGWRRSPVVSKRSGFVTKGNGAVMTALRRGWDVPIDEQEYSSDEEEIRDMLADNRIAELAENDERKLTDLLSALGADIEKAGFSDLDLSSMLERLGENPEQSLREIAVKSPPKMAWVLVGIPLVRFAEINPHIQAIAALPETFVETAASDQTPDEEDETPAAGVPVPAEYPQPENPDASKN